MCELHTAPGIDV